MGTILVLLSAPLVEKRVDNGSGGMEIAVPTLALDREVNALTDSLQQAKRAVALHVAFATRRRLRQQLTAHRPAVLHFSGHVRAVPNPGMSHPTSHPKLRSRGPGRRVLQGTKDALLFESDDYAGEGHSMRVDDLKGLISAGGTMVELVFVAACHSEAAATAFLDAGVRSVVAVRLHDTLQDDAAIKFTEQFYLALAPLPVAKGWPFGLAFGRRMLGPTPHAARCRSRATRFGARSTSPWPPSTAPSRASLRSSRRTRK